MTFTHNGFTYRIEFQHEHFNPSIEVDTQYRGKRLISTITSCVVWERPGSAPVEDEYVFATGQSLCAEGDRFVKAEGAERSLRRAADQVDEDRTLRGKILEAYFTRRHTNGGHSKTA